MKDVSLSQDELKVLVGTLSNLQVPLTIAPPLNNLLLKLDSYIEKPKPEEVEVKKPEVIIPEVVK
jgi:hypothetical protein